MHYDDIPECPVARENRRKFAMRQTYVKEPAQSYVCKRCGGDTFYVGSSECFTVIRCPTCQWEVCVHDG